VRRWTRDVRDVARLLLVAVPPALVAVWAVARPDAPRYLGLALVAALGASVVLAWSVRSALARRLRTVSSVLTSYREGDFSIRARAGDGAASLEDVLVELNQLGDILRDHRLGEMEAWALLRKVMAEVDVVVLAFDDRGRLRLANDAAARLLGRPAASMSGEHAAALGIDEVLGGAAPRTVKESTAFGLGPWELRRGAFRLSGEPHTLVVLSDVSGALRENEREAWRRLIRVMGHEINNSLAPIRSITESLSKRLAASPRGMDLDDDLHGGLGVIGRRAEALGRFMESYARLARLPAPRLEPLDLGPIVRKTAALEQRSAVEVVAGPDVTVHVDADQLEQVLINLLKNAVEATLEADGGSVRVSWAAKGKLVEIAIEDEGPGVGDTANLFVPFFTTKPEGSGIGLVLSRQIVEAHHGVLSLGSRPDRRGAIAVVRLPLARSDKTIS
jgi:two-component system, NtrC family, nitrogen regulation sensor histidine kinase NtrY